MNPTSRRRFLSGTGGALAALQGHVSSGQPTVSAKTKLILLGTAGGPRPRNSRAAPSQVIWVNNTAYVVDCGNGVAIQMTRARLPLTAVRHVFITHHHSDHNADYGNLLLLAWQSGLQSRVDTWGPPPIDRMTDLFFDMNRYDIDTRIKDEGRNPLIPLIHPHQLMEGGTLFKDDHVSVTCALVEHPPIAPAFAYRFDTVDRSIVISGDTKPCDALIRLARNADILVHEVMYPPALDRLLAPLPNAAALKKSILSHHTPVAEVGRVAQEAGVKTLVLSHFVPAEDPGVTEEMWIETARGPFNGRIIAGRDLLEI